MSVGHLHEFVIETTFQDLLSEIRVVCVAAEMVVGVEVSFLLHMSEIALDICETSMTSGAV